VAATYVEMSGSNIRGELARVDAGTTKARQLHPDKWPRHHGMPLAKHTSGGHLNGIA